MFRNSRVDYGRLWPWEYEIRKGYKQISDSFIFFFKFGRTFCSLQEFDEYG